MSAYRHQAHRGPVHHQQQQGQYYRQHVQRVQQRGPQDIPLLISPHVALGLLLALLLIPLALLFASEIGGFGQYLSGGMFRNLGLGLAYPKWEGGHRPAHGRGTKVQDTGSDSGSESGDGKRKARKHRHSTSEKDKKKKKSSNGVVANGTGDGYHYYAGLVNVSGSYCFLNSVVQALASLEHLKPYLAIVQARAEALDVDTPVIDALHDAMTALNTPRKRPTTLKPIPLIQALSAPPPNPDQPGQPPSSSRTSALFSSREHQDAQELFILLSERVKEEALAVEREGKQTGVGLRGFDPRSVQNGRVGGGGGSGVPGTGLGRVKNPFDGLTANRRSCVQCGYTEAVMHFHFSCWSLSLPRAHTLHLEDCLADYTRLELLDDCVCRKCSLIATLERVSADIERLAGSASSVTPLTTSSTQNKNHVQFAVLPNGEPAPSAHSNGDAHAPETTGGGGLSESKKRRLRDLRKVEKRLKEMLEEGRVEEDLDIPSSSTATITNANAGEKSKKRLKKEKEKEKAVSLEKVVSKCSTRQSMVARPPPILAIHLSRTLHFGHATKSNAHVVFERELDLTPYTTSGRLSTRPEAPISSHPESSRMGRFGAPGGRSRARSITPTPERVRGRYRLVSVVCHYGSAGWGHYVCYRRRPEGNRDRDQSGGTDGKEGGHKNDEEESDGSGSGGEEEDTALNWIRTSDTQVDYVSWERVRQETTGVFMLFYERVVPGPVHTADLSNSMASSMMGSWMPAAGGPMAGLGNAGLSMPMSMSVPNLRQGDATAKNLVKSLELETSDLVDPGGPLPRTITRGELRNRSPSMSSQETIRPRASQPKNQSQTQGKDAEGRDAVSGKPAQSNSPPVEIKEKEKEKEKEKKDPGSKFTTFVVTSASKKPAERPMTPSSTFGTDSLASLTDGLENTPTMSTLSSLSRISDDTDSITDRGSDLGSSLDSSGPDHDLTSNASHLPNGDHHSSVAIAPDNRTSISKTGQDNSTSTNQYPSKGAKRVPSSLGGPKPAVPTSNTIGLRAY